MNSGWGIINPYKLQVVQLFVARCGKKQQPFNYPKFSPKIKR